VKNIGKRKRNALLVVGLILYLSAKAISLPAVGEGKFFIAYFLADCALAVVFVLILLKARGSKKFAVFSLSYWTVIDALLILVSDDSLSFLFFPLYFFTPIFGLAYPFSSFIGSILWKTKVTSYFIQYELHGYVMVAISAVFVIVSALTLKKHLPAEDADSDENAPLEEIGEEE